MFLRLACGAQEGTLRMHELHVSFFSVQSLIDTSHMTERVIMWVSQWETFVSFFSFDLVLGDLDQGHTRRKKSTPSELCSFSNTSRTKLSGHFHFHSKQSSLRDLRFFFSFPSLGERPSTPVHSILHRSFRKLCHRCLPISTMASPPQHSRVSHHYLKPSLKVNFLFGFFLFLFGSSQLSLPFDFLSLCLLFSVNLSNRYLALPSCIVLFSLYCLTYQKDYTVAAVFLDSPFLYCITEDNKIRNKKVLL